MSRRLFAIALTVLLFWPGYCAAQTPEPGPIRVGDRWSYDIKDGLTGDLRRSTTIAVVDVNDKEITTRVMERGKERPQMAVFAPDWGRIDEGGWKASPSGLGIRGPLEVGKEWRSDANATNLQSGITFRVSGAAKVVAQEKATTPAGTFDTFRVDMTMRLVNTTDQTKAWTWTFVVWYAPAVNRWVRKKSESRFDGRVRDSFSEELTEYLRKP
jgi:hypothetical protein